MPPDGVQILGRCTNQRQAEVLAAQLAKGELPDMELTDWLGEQDMVIRVRKTPTYWQVENWPRQSLLQGEPDASFP